MSLELSGQKSLTFEIKSAQLPLVVLHLKSADVQALEQDLRQRFGDLPDFFDQDPLLVDLSGLQQDDAIDMTALLGLLRSMRLVPLAARGGSALQMEAALAVGLVRADDATLSRAQRAEPAELAQAEAVRTVVEATYLPPLVIDKPLRSGQQVYARGRDLVIMAMVNPGAEVIADGHIHVYATLRGKAMAGARGFSEARIFALGMEPELLSISGIYRTSETPLPPEVRGKPAQVRLLSGEQGDKLLLDPIS